MEDKKKPLASKTIIVSILITILGALEGFGWVDVFSDPRIGGYIIFGIGIVMGILRKVTSKPI